MVMDKREQYNSIIKNANESLSGLVGRLEKDVEKYNDKINPLFAGMPPSCGSMSENPYAKGATLSASEKRTMKDAQDEISKIEDQLLQNPIKFGDAGKIIPPKTKFTPGKGKGDKEGIFKVPGLGGRPPWFDLIIGGLGELIGEPDIGRKGLDYVEAASGLQQGYMKFKKQKALIVEPTKQIYVLLDQSGSMDQYAFKGRNLLELLASFIPELGKEYEGFLWVCSDCNMSYYDADESSVPNKSVKLEDVTTSLIYSGGGGTSFDGAFAKLGNIERTKKRQNSDYEMSLVFFSDMQIDTSEFKTYSKLGPTHQIYVSLETKKDEIPDFIYKDPNFKVVLIDAEKEKK
jgi:hypothetical protein